MLNTTSSSTHKILWTCDSPSHYNDFLFKELSGVKKWELSIHYRRAEVLSHPWKTAFRVGYQSRVQRCCFGVDWYIISEVVFRSKTIFVFGGWSGINSILSILLCSLLGRRYFVWTDTPDLWKSRGKVFSLFRGIFLKLCFKYARAIFATGKPAMNALSEMGVSSEKLVNFPYCVNVESMTPKVVRNQVGKKIKFVSAGRVLNSLKGHDCAVRALAEVCNRNPHMDFEYLIAGTGPDVESLRNRAAELGVADKVQILGWIEPNQLIKLLHESDLFIHPSPVHEPYGVAVLEAMAAGMAVFASNRTCAALDRIENGKNGFIHMAGDAVSLANQICSVIKDPKYVARIQQAAMETASRWTCSYNIEILGKVIDYR